MCSDTFVTHSLGLRGNSIEQMRAQYERAPDLTLAYKLQSAQNNYNADTSQNGSPFQNHRHHEHDFRMNAQPQFENFEFQTQATLDFMHLRARTGSFENQGYQPHPPYASITYQAAGKQVSDDELSKYFPSSPRAERYQPTNANMIFDHLVEKTIHTSEDIHFSINESHEELPILRCQDAHETNDMIVPDTVSNYKQAYILEDTITVHKIDNDDHMKAQSLLF